MRAHKMLWSVLILRDQLIYHNTKWDFDLQQEQLTVMDKKLSPWSNPLSLTNRDKGLKKLCRAIQALGIGHEPYWMK